MTPCIRGHSSGGAKRLRPSEALLDAAPPCGEEDDQKGSSAASAADAASGIEGTSGVLDAGSKEKGLCPSGVGDGEGSGWGSAVEASASVTG